ncbi:Reverse transcriptase domain-containing protein, partial [Aphis craccivora]
RYVTYLCISKSNKVDIITIIHKKGPTTSFSNKLIDYLETNNILFQNRFGFKLGKALAQAIGIPGSAFAFFTLCLKNSKKSITMYNVIPSSLNNIKTHNLKSQFICYADDTAICIVDNFL